MLPPFFFKDVDDDGVFDAYASVIDQVGDRNLRLYLYHIPSVTAVAISAAVVARLVEAYGEVIAGIKDSAADWPHTAELLRQFPHLSVFVGAEHHLARALGMGAAGTICGLANVIPELMRQLHDAARFPSASGALARVESLVAAFEGRPFVPTLKVVMAYAAGEKLWRNLRPPLSPLAATDEAALLAEIARVGLGPVPV